MKPFFFDTNQVSRRVETIEQWRETLAYFKRAYPGSDPYACQGSIYSEANFGLYEEHSGGKTLGEFFDEYGIQQI
jgi:hypothetical protein